MKIAILFITLIESYFYYYRNHAENAVAFFDRHTEVREILSQYLTEQEVDMALAIVSPELSQFSQIEDFTQQKAMQMSYILYGIGDFSIGYFQMKASFAEKLEKVLSNDSSLLHVFGTSLLNTVPCINEYDVRKQRRDRLLRMSTLDGQTLYLAAFILIVKKRTKNMFFGTEFDQLRYWATLYNSGMDKSEKEVYSIQKQKQFPRFGKRFNYSDVVQEFYVHIKDNKTARLN